MDMFLGVPLGGDPWGRRQTDWWYSVSHVFLQKSRTKWQDSPKDQGLKMYELEKRTGWF